MWTSKARRGMSIPDTILYYQACHLARVLDWCRHAQLKQWVDVELHSSTVFLPGLPWCSTQVPWAGLNHPTIGATWDVCQETFQLKGISPTPSPLFPIIGNPAFSPGNADPGFKILLNAMDFCATHFFHQSQWATFSRLTLVPNHPDEIGNHWLANKDSKRSKTC